MSPITQDLIDCSKTSKALLDRVLMLLVCCCLMTGCQSTRKLTQILSPDHSAGATSSDALAVNTTDLAIDTVASTDAGSAATPVTTASFSLDDQTQPAAVQKHHFHTHASQSPLEYQPVAVSDIQQVFWQQDQDLRLPGFESDFLSLFDEQGNAWGDVQQQANELLNQFQQLEANQRPPASQSSQPMPALPAVKPPLAPAQQPATGPALELPPPVMTENESGEASLRVMVPFRTSLPADAIGFQSDNGMISLTARDTPLSAVMAIIAERNGLSVICADAGELTISVTLNEVELNDALDAIVAAAGCTWSRYRNIITVTQVNELTRHHPAMQGREVQVIPLNYVSASDIEPVITGLLSPVGKIFTSETETRNQKKTQELIIVEDLPDYLQRIQNLVAQYDKPPRQVMIEAHILRVNLNDELQHGVNFDFLSQIAGADITLEAAGIATSTDSAPGFFLNIDGTDVDALVQAIRDTTDAKTLANPKVMVLNGQEAKIQIGERLSYISTTTTQTSTLENVNFLDVGVVLTVTPIISDDGRILMKVLPKVSTGAVNDTTGLPNEQTTEIDTTVMLNDGQGLIVGGLIQERDTDDQSKLPYLGDLWKVGRLFQRRQAVKNRSEVLIALVPRLVPYAYHEQQCEEHINFERVSTPLFVNGLERVIRPEPVLPDAYRNPRRIQYDRLSHSIPNLHDCYPLPHEYYVPSATQSGECPPPQCAPGYKY